MHKIMHKMLFPAYNDRKYLIHFQCAVDHDRNFNVGLFSETIWERSLKFWFMITSTELYTFMSFFLTLILFASSGDRENNKTNVVIVSSFKCESTEHGLFLFCLRGGERVCVLCVDVHEWKLRDLLKLYCLNVDPPNNCSTSFAVMEIMRLF